jgi:subtilisin
MTATTRILILLLAFSTTGMGQAPTADKYIVTFRAGTSQGQRANAAERAGARVRYNYSNLNAVAITVGNPNALARLRADASVESIVPDRLISAIQSSNGVGPTGKPAPGGGGGGTGQIIPEGVKRVGLPTGTSNGLGIGVAIVDTGIDLTHTDLAPSLNMTFSAFGASCQDDNGHGTHATGIVAALDNTSGVVGVAPRAKPYCVKVLDASGNGSDSDVIAGLEWVLNNAEIANPKIRVVNMSLGRDGSIGDNAALRTAIQNLYNAGITVVVAAGNEASKEVRNMVPAVYPEVLAVASTTATDGASQCHRFSGVIRRDTASYFTTDGRYQQIGDLLAGVTISAPGEDKEDISKACLISSVGILSTRLGGGTTRMSGTSMAAPHVAGVVARMIQLGTVGVENIRFTLRSSSNAQGVGATPLDSPTSTYTFDGEREGVVKAP